MYFGSRAEAIPAWKTPQRVAADAPSSAAPDTRGDDPARPARGTTGVPDSAAPVAPRAPRTWPARMYAPPRPVRYGSATIPMRRVIRSKAAISMTWPSSARFLAGPDSPAGAASRPRPPAAIAADPVNTNGISR